LTFPLQLHTEAIVFLWSLGLQRRKLMNSSFHLWVTERYYINFSIYLASNERTEWPLEQILEDVYVRYSLENLQNVRCLTA